MEEFLIALQRNRPLGVLARFAVEACPERGEEVANVAGDGRVLFQTHRCAAGKGRNPGLPTLPECLACVMNYPHAGIPEHPPDPVAWPHPFVADQGGPPPPPVNHSAAPKGSQWNSICPTETSNSETSASSS